MGLVFTESSNANMGVEGGEGEGGFVGIGNFVGGQGRLVFIIIRFVLAVFGGFYRDRLFVYCRMNVSPLNKLIG